MMKTKGLTQLWIASLVALMAYALMHSPLSAQPKTKSQAPSPGIDPSEIQALSSPIRIAFGPGGTLLVTDYDLKMVVFVDPMTNEIKGGFPVDGHPLGIVHARKKIYVGNETKACISVFAEDGRWMEDIGGGVLAPLTTPTDLAVDLSTNRLFVLDFGAKAVKILALNGSARGTVPSVTPDPVALSTPTAIAWDPVRLELLVSDFGGLAPDGSTIDPRVQIFDSGGNLAGTISSYAAGGMMGGSYRFSRPQGVQADAQGNIVLTDSYSGEVLILDRNTGLVLKTLGGFGVDPGKMRLPLDLVMDDVSKDVFVTNNLLKRIEIFRQGGVY